MHSFRYLFAIFFTLCFSTSKAQHDLNLLFGFDLTSLTLNYRFQQGGQVLNKYSYGNYGSLANQNIKLNYRFHNLFGVEATLQLSEFDFAVEDHSFVKNHNVHIQKPHYEACFGFWKEYLTVAGALYAYIPLDNKDNDRTFLYIAGGPHLNDRIPAAQRTKVQNYDYYDEHLKITCTYKKYFSGYYIESGINLYNSQDYSFYFGIKYNVAGIMMQADYTDIHNDTILTSDHATSNGSSIGITLRYGGSLWFRPSLHHKSPNHHVHSKHHKHSKGNKHQEENKSQSHETIKIEKIVPSETTPKLINQRTVKITKQLHVKSDHIKITVWDHETVDGDALSLNLNGEWILKNYALIAKQYTIEKTLAQGSNYLLMNADNMGKYKPCTAAIVIDDGNTKQEVILDSDFQSSSTIEIIVDK